MLPYLRLAGVIGLAALFYLSWGQGSMPAGLKKELNGGSFARALAQLKRHPEWVNTREDEERMTPLHYAASYGPAGLVRWLVKHGARVDDRCYNDFSALHLAHNGEIAQILLKAGARRDLHSAFGVTPLQYAAEEAGHGVKDRQGVVDAFLESGERLDVFSAMFLHKGEAVRKTIRADSAACKAEAGGLTLLYLAAQDGDLPTARLLLERGADVNAGRGQGLSFSEPTALSAAVWARQTKMVEFLCSKGADPTHKFESEGMRRSMLPEISKILNRYRALWKGR